MQQRQYPLDFERQSMPIPEVSLPAESALIAQGTSLPPPAMQGPPPSSAQLVRPDRQIVYPDLADHFDWPDPNSLHDRDTITVDRIRDDIDGPSHRFIIRHGDTVEVLISAEKLELGKVVGISHANAEVCVRFPQVRDGGWFSTGQIYPAARESTKPCPSSTPLSEIIAELNAEHAAAFTEADRVPRSPVPYTFEEFKEFYREFQRGTVPFPDYREQFERLYASQDLVKEDLVARFKAKELSVLANRMGSWDAKRFTKQENATHCVTKMLSYYTLGDSVCYQPLSGETYQEAIARIVRSSTEADYHRYFEQQQEKSQAHEKALTTPETFAEFRTFIREKGEEALTDEQLSTYDMLHADMSHERRAKETPTTVTKFHSEELQGIRFQLKEGFHDKRQCPLWIVQLESRVEREAYNELNRKAKMLGGWFSSFKKDSAGFQFLEKDQADRFCSLLSGDADRTDVLEARKEKKELTAAERLHELASELFERAEQTILRSNDSLQNTARRAGIQAGVRGSAYADQALSRTLHSIGEALSRGEAGYLDGIRHKTHVETLDSVLTLAKWARIRAYKRQGGESTFEHGRRVDRIELEPIGSETIRYAEYPFPHVYKRHLEDLVSICRQKKGVKQAADKMAKRLSCEKAEYLTFKAEHDVAALTDFLERAKAVGVDVERVSTSLEKYKRLQRANITDIHELRAALREYLRHRAEKRGDSPVQIAERDLIGKDLPGFFPTPRPIIERMLELAEVKARHRVLEPSCGKGDILDALQEACPGIEHHAIEQNRTLADVLSAKGHEVEFGDFLDHYEKYDRIVMNPPFEAGQDMTHIQHAYSLLVAGGRLVSVISEGPFFRSDKQSTAFREWLAELGAETEPLPEDAFQGQAAFRETGVRTRLLFIDKE